MMALHNNCLLFSQQLLQLDWDPHPLSFGLGLGDVHDLTTSMPSLDADSPMSSEASTGYLQDAVSQWRDRCKRRRLAMGSYDAAFVTEDVPGLLQSFWDSTCYGDPLGNLNFLVGDNGNVSGENLQNSPSQVTQKELVSPPSSQKKPMPATSDKEESHNSRYPATTLKALIPLNDELDQQERENMRKNKKVVYPFAVLKPVGLEGDLTLADINKRILMRPTRPVKHPVGEFAIGPCVSGDGRGLSGKDVVGLRSIHTKGRGTITVIRTRG